MPTISLDNFSKKYEYYRKEPGISGSVKALFHRKKLFVEAVKDVNFSIEEGELVGFLGPNGAGKTTTLKALSGIIYPSTGTINVLGYIPWERQKSFQKQLALVMGQKNQLLSDLPARESFNLRRAIYEVPKKEYNETLDELVQLLDVENILDIQVRKLSLGQKMKCELIAALLHRPKVLLLDEPTIGLDVLAQKNIRDFIKKYNKASKTTILLTSHYMEDIRQLCKRVIIINLGKIMYDGNLNELLKKYADYKTLRVIFTSENISRDQLALFGEIVEFENYRCTLKVPSEKSKEMAIKILSSDLPVEDVLIHEANIDEVIREIFNSKTMRT
jgi:ABC-2 type transport system ATP-binding protein